MRVLASSLLPLALITLAGAPLQAQHADTSSVVGRWFGRAELAAPWSPRVLNVRLDIQPGGAVAGRIGDALLADARLFPDSRVAHALGLARDHAIEGRLAGSIMRSEGIYRERIYITLDCTLDRMVGELHTSGSYDGPLFDRVITARVTLERQGPAVAVQGGSARLTPAPVDARPLSP
jgi:hypothetical protein